MNERIKEVRKARGLSQDEFGRRLGVTRGAVTNIELNKVEPKPLFVDLICREFDVNEEWLRTGKGEMFLPKSRGQEIGEIVKAAAQHDPETAAKFFSSLLEEMSDAEIVLMYEIFKRHFPSGE